MINEYEPQTITHPGNSLNEKLQEMQMTQKEFALLIAQSEKTINSIINGASSITPSIAAQFENVLKIPAKFWLKRQQQYDEILAKNRKMQLSQNFSVAGSLQSAL